MKWDELREMAWEWDPIGVADAREFARDEYDCLIEEVVPLLQRGADAREVVAHFAHFFPEHFGLPLQAGAEEFAEKSVAWWRSVDG